MKIVSQKPTRLLQAPTRWCVQMAHYSAVKHKIFPSKILLQCVCMKKWREGKERTSRVANTRRMRSATKDGSSAYPTTANCSIWSVFTGNLQIPYNNLYVSVMWNPSLDSFWSKLATINKTSEQSDHCWVWPSNNLPYLAIIFLSWSRFWSAELFFRGEGYVPSHASYIVCISNQSTKSSPLDLGFSWDSRCTWPSHNCGLWGT